MKKITLILFALIFISISACKKDEANTPTGLVITAYPTTIGSEWRYKKTITHIVNNDTSLFNYSRVLTIEKDSTINGIDVVKYTTIGSEMSGSSASFKRQTSQGIYTHAYFGVSDVDLYFQNSNSSTK